MTMKLLVVDDDPQILDALSVGFQLHWPDARVIPCANGESALQAFFEEVPDLVVLDIALPGMDGLQLLREIRRVSDTPVIMLTASGRESDQVRGLELGADDYVVKPFGYLALLARVRAVLRRAHQPMPAPLDADLAAGPLSINSRTRQVTLEGNPVQLTSVEYRLLYHLARNAGRVMSHDALLSLIWGEDRQAGRDHLKVFVSRLRAKIETPSGLRFIETERGLGYRFSKPASG